MRTLKELKPGELIFDPESKYKGETIVWRVIMKNYGGIPNSVLLGVSSPHLRKANYQTDSEMFYEFKNSYLKLWLNNKNYDKKYKENGFLSYLGDNFNENIIESTISGEKLKVFLTSSSEFNNLNYNLKKTLNDNDGYIGSFNRDKCNTPYLWSGFKGALGNNGVADSGEPNHFVPWINVRDDIKITDSPDSKYQYSMVWNQPPSKPESFTLPEKAISRTETEISWSKSTDPEGDSISYKLERSLDSGAFVERYKGSFTRYKDIIEDKGHKSVVYKVTAIDSNGNESESLTSASIPVSDNTIPTIETTSADLGKITAAYSVSYKVVDPDEGQTWTVTESLDGKVLKTFDAKVGTSYTSKLSASDWQKVLNGKHILKIEVVDSDGGKSAKEISFEKSVNKLDFMLDKTGVQGIDKMPERAILSMSANIPAEASIKIEITNNGLDEKPVWQDCTAQVLGNEKIFFSNKEKTAEKWAVNVRVTGDKKTATDVLSVSVIGGFYD